jgi:iron complex outermembrane recepter protein
MSARLTSLAAACAALGTCSVLAQPTQVLITGSIVEREAFEAPYAIGAVGRDELRSAGPLVNLSEAMARVPGLVVANRWNFAQDLQISSRGFGARAGFGVRGMRLLADGIPATGPDGQGQVSQFDLGSAERIEVLRGPFSVLYGNSSGGVISLVSAPVKEAQAEGELDVGSFGLRQLRGQVAAPFGGGFDARVSASAMRVDGFRPHSEARRGTVNARLGWRGASDTVTVLAGTFSQPADDPLGLTRTQFDEDPLQTTPQATQFDTRKEQKQNQLGATWKHRFGEGALRELQLMAYGGRRSVTQWLAIMPTTQANSARHGGGVVDFDRDFAGTEARLRWSFTGVELLAGAALEDQRDARRGYENFTGPPSAPTAQGVIGNLRRDETDRARSRDVFAQAEWAIGGGVSASGGVRSGRVHLAAEDHYLANGDDSGALDFSYTNPALGLRWQPAPGLQFHASAARGFESPTLNELAYQAGGANGLNTALKPQKSRQVELGAKWRAEGVEFDAALFQANVEDEIGVATNAGGRSAFQNVGRTKRRGAELSALWQPAAAWRARVAATVLRATYEDDFLACAGIPCSAPTVPVAAGNRIAGTQPRSGFAEVLWRGGAWGDWALEARGAGRTAVNDVNGDFAGGYGVAALRVSRSLALGGSGQKVELLARVDNLFDRVHAGSVIVNEANGRYFETGAPRAFLLALRFTGAL